MSSCAALAAWLCFRTPWALSRHADTPPSLKPLEMAGVRGMSPVLTESAASPPHRVCSDGFDRVWRAGTAAIGRPDGTVGAVSAHSAPQAHSRRRKRTVGAATAQSAPSAHSGRRQPPTQPRQHGISTSQHPERSPTTALSEEPRGATNLSPPGGHKRDIPACPAISAVRRRWPRPAPASGLSRHLRGRGTFRRNRAGGRRCRRRIRNRRGPGCAVRSAPRKTG
ncbi:hypothetical protein LAUMK7_03981 [Mycobacterium kansasii]|uniref:Uncharacterized protein n=1 Tax=Mycobacterium kansasii TaxID=1768 RepID=A0A653EZ01_MYCKA|nr:hypothetical protein MKANGN_34580 [Mycobacterium kansasii]VAZ61537.1 hypothetical protein LAUMK22_03349 [Mycobacterium kansasii]VAZ67867.1 hypothetical protein LAUMK40_04009 [Mycobacterium kansasii]VAZ77678.1 hypothetical protein LAUMK7_03981 [Mycobacterium kansasii]VTP02764.1 hypothetical protein BIN_B_03645 [Mycobacterium kansasii]